MIADFHSHILPGMDDGSASPEESLAMLRESARQGIRQVILTPHFYPQRHSPERFLERRRQSMELLQQCLPGQELPSLRLGAEVYYFPQMGQSAALEQLAIEGTRAILVEMPMGVWTERMYRDLEQLHSNLGLIPIVAHVDRYLGRFRDYGIPKALSQLPVMVQANASCFLEGGWGMKLLRNRQVQLLGSDCHNMKDRSPNLGHALRRIEQKLGTDAVRWLQSNERKLLR